MKCLKPSKRDAPAGMFLASAFGLQVAAQLAYGAPANGCPRHRRSEKGSHFEDRAPLFRANTIERSVIPNTLDTNYSSSELLGAPRKHQSVYEASYRK